MRKNIIISFFFLFTIFNGYVCAHDNELIHPKLTEQAAQDSYFKNYLSKYLNFENGLESTLSLSGQKYNILEWLQQGSKQEDSPMCRASNHFHDPMNKKSWNASAMSDSPWWINVICNSYVPYFSNVTWATGLTSPTATPIPYDPNNFKSPNIWGNARTLFYNALTTPAKTDREAYFAQTFLAVGQVLHLLQDMSVPAHARNDFMSHLVFNGFCTNGQCSGDPTRWFGNPFEYYIQNNQQLVTSDNPQSPSFSNPRLSDFWDTDQYNGTNPSNSTTLGLAEITNANYFSDNTIPNNGPSNEHVYPFPAINSNDYNICVHNEMGTTNPRKYICRNNSSNPFGAISLLNEEPSITNNNISTLQMFLDDNVHDTYAKELLPLAIGYSSQVLSYFFRGRLEAAMGDGSLTVKNTSTETIASDNADTNFFILYYDNATGDRTPLTTKVKANTLAPGDQQTIPFTPPQDTVSSYTLVYSGKLGDETNAVIPAVFIGNYYIFYLKDGDLQIANCSYDNDIKVISTKSFGASGNTPVTFLLKRFSHNVSGNLQDLYFIATSLYLNTSSYDRTNPFAWLNGSSNSTDVCWYILDPLLNKLYLIPNVSGLPFAPANGASINFSADNNSIYVAQGGTIYKYHMNKSQLILDATDSYTFLGQQYDYPGFVGRDGTIKTYPASTSSGSFTPVPIITNVPGLSFLPPYDSVIGETIFTFPNTVEVFSKNGYYDYDFINYTQTTTRTASGSMPVFDTEDGYQEGYGYYEQTMNSLQTSVVSSLIISGIAKFRQFAHWSALFGYSTWGFWQQTTGENSNVLNSIEYQSSILMGKTPRSSFYYHQMWADPDQLNNLSLCFPYGDVVYTQLNGVIMPECTPKFWGNIDDDKVLIQSFTLAFNNNTVKKMYKNGSSVIGAVATAVKAIEENVLGLVYLPKGGN